MLEREKEIAKIVGTMFAAYDKSNAERIVIYAKMLSQVKVSVEVIDTACKNLTFKSVFLPQIAEIVAEIDELTKGSTAALPWDEAWNIINREMRRNWQSPNFERPEIEAVVRKYGWGDICCCLEKDLPYIKAQLRQMYEQHCNRQVLERRQALTLTSSGKQIDEGVSGVLKAWPK